MGHYNLPNLFALEKNNEVHVIWRYHVDKKKVTIYLKKSFKIAITLEKGSLHTLLTEGKQLSFRIDQLIFS